MVTRRCVGPQPRARVAFSWLYSSKREGLYLVTKMWRGRKTGGDVETLQAAKPNIILVGFEFLLLVICRNKAPTFSVRSLRKSPQYAGVRWVPLPVH